MSSDEEDTRASDGVTKVAPKRRRLQRSCDMCRKRKIRCDSASLPDGRCSNCIAFNAACTHSEPTRKRGPKNKHVEELKQQVESLEAQLRSHNSDTSRASTIQYPSPPSDSSPSPGSLPEEDLSHDQISERFRALSIDSMKNRFFGPSSGFMLVKSTMDAKEAYLGRPMTAHTRRPEFWDLRPWEQESYDDKPIYVYPESDLISSLMALYFTHVHPILPLLHRPTFERSVKEGLHLRNHLFGASLLGVLAVASRYSDDPRVLVEGSNSTLSCGWKYFRQVQVVRKSLFDEPTIYEVQLYCLITLYSLGSSSPQSSWLYLGLGMRFIQERGEHRRKREGHKFTPETELWKRAFWVLLSLDRQICCFLGRPTAIHVEDYDVELPMEVDDEYWDHPDPEQAFKQPSGKPSLLTFFICHIRLSEILGSTLRRLYASNKSRVLMGLVGPDWEQRAVAELDSAMNDFLHSVPSHLRWDPNRTGVFFNQSALLYAFYYQLQITIHRPYIHKPNLLALTSLAICTSAARSGIHVADLWLQKFQILALPFMQTTIFFSGVVLLLNLFGVKRAGLAIDVSKEIAHVEMATRALKFCETRWQTAGRLYELLQELQSWDGPPPSRHPSTSGVHLANMCPACGTKHTTHMCPASPAGVETTEGSVFTQSTAPDAPGISYFTVTDELSPHPIHERTQPAHPPTTNNGWNTISSSDVFQTCPNPLPELTMDQLLTATLPEEYDVAGNFKSPVDQWNQSTGLGSMVTDDELMSMWMAAPTGLGNMADWDAYIENKTGMNWPTYG